MLKSDESGKTEEIQQVIVNMTKLIPFSGLNCAHCRSVRANEEGEEERLVNKVA